MDLIESPPAQAEEYFPQSLREKYLLSEKIEQFKLSKDAKPANIGWEPSWEEFQRLSQKRQAENVLEQAVPQGWPDQVHGPLVWQTGDFTEESKYVIELSSDDKAEVIEAIASWRSKYETPVVNRRTISYPERWTLRNSNFYHQSFI